MQTDFFILCAQTVPENYTWDVAGSPLQFASNVQLPDTNQIGVTGYAPALNVVFFNSSIYDPRFDLIDFSWDFGDYYHTTNNNITLSCDSLVQHTYIMPGTYSVTLKQTATRTIPPLPATDLKCRDKYGINWYWDKHTCLVPETSATNAGALKWDDVECTSDKSKWWDSEFKCLQKYCNRWSWYDLRLSGANPVKWTEAATNQIYQKKWMYEPNDTICTVLEAPFLNTTETIEQTVIKTLYITVKEIPPVASINRVTTTVGSSPLVVRLSPRNCISGSFPIDRIDWDFGDGSPIKTVSRYTLPLDPETINTEFFISDPEDVRNIDVIHTYYRSKDTYPVFYPSLTCYSANTNTFDSCCITVGPISFNNSPSDLHLLKTRNTDKGKVFTFSQNNNIAFTTTSPIVSTFIPSYPTIPPLIIRDSTGEVQSYFGHPNNSNEFPGVYTPQCIFPPILLPGDYFIVEDPEQYQASAEDEVPIKTEKDRFVLR